MKYLLVGINAKYIHSNLAVYSLRSYAKKYTGVDVELKEYTINMQIEDIVRSIYGIRPDFIGLSVYIWNIEIVLKVVRDIRKLMPDVIIYLGGPEVSFDSKTVLSENPEINGVMVGEGEEVFASLIRHYEGEASYSDLAKASGITYREEEGTIISNPPGAVLDLSTVPFAYKDLKDFDNRIIYYETSRGCPYGCSYCLSSVEKKLRFRDMKLVKEELKFFIDNKVPQVKFVDRTFNADHSRSEELLEYIKTNDNGVTNFHFEIAGDILTDREIELINGLRPGLVQLEIGVQSTNPDTLKAINRRTDIERLKANVAKLLEGAKVHLHLDLIAGLPYENLISFKNSFNDVYAMGSHELQLGFLKMLKGAPISAMTSSQEIIYSDYAPYEILSTKNLSFEDVCELKAVEEMLEIYHNSCQFDNSEKLMLQYESSPYDMYKNLAEYYKENDYQTMQSKRAFKYEVLIGYAKDKLGLEENMLLKLRYALTIDYYLRENAKSRPSFAVDVNEYKESLHSLGKQYQGQQVHIEPEMDGNRFLLFDYSKRSRITGNVQITVITEG